MLTIAKNVDDDAHQEGARSHVYASFGLLLCSFAFRKRCQGLQMWWRNFYQALPASGCQLLVVPGILPWRVGNASGLCEDDERFVPSPVHLFIKLHLSDASSDELNKGLHGP